MRTIRAAFKCLPVIWNSWLKFEIALIFCFITFTFYLFFLLKKMSDHERICRGPKEKYRLELLVQFVLDVTACTCLLYYCNLSLFWSLLSLQESLLLRREMWLFAVRHCVSGVRSPFELCAHDFKRDAQAVADGFVARARTFISGNLAYGKCKMR